MQLFHSYIVLSNKNTSVSKDSYPGVKAISTVFPENPTTVGSPYVEVTFCFLVSPL